jgi:tetratricopeptide (TPR) repeat protein
MYIIMRALLVVLMAAACSGSVRADDHSNCFGTGVTSWDDPKLWDPGIASCTRLISGRTGKYLSEAYGARASWQHKKGNHDAALADYDRALSIDPTNVEFYDYRADTLAAKGDFDHAIDNYLQAIRIDPTYAPAHYSLGQLYEKKGDLERARLSYRAALVPPEQRKVQLQVRVQKWAQENARKRLKELDRTSK